MLVSFGRQGHSPDLTGFALNRALGRRRFSSGERRLVRIFHLELNRHLGRTLIRERGGPLHELPPRLREALTFLLEGDSEKQAELRMGLSRHTVHEYVTALYRRLGVQSRAELMAMCHRHRFPPRDRP